MPTGGVSPDKENLSGWFNAGVTCVGMGSQLISKEILANKDFDKLRLNVANALKLITEVRN
jgi:2-dehydro-3-deoxyphosphogluconate aldolase/(4S)-4-hydroxy-2-oxoglutarate aldolase